MAPADQKNRQNNCHPCTFAWTSSALSLADGVSIGIML